MSKSSNKLSLHIGSEIGLKNFSFSQLILEVKRLFDGEGIPGFVKMMVILVEGLLIKSQVTECPRCSSNKLQMHGKCGTKDEDIDWLCRFNFIANEMHSM